MSTTYLQGPAAGTSRTSGISSATVNAAKTYLGSGVDNSANLDAYADLEVVWSFAVAPSLNNYLQIYLLYAPDGTNYEEPSTGDGSTTSALPLGGCMVGAVSPPADTATHRKTLGGIPILPYKFRLFVYNSGTGQTAVVTVNLTTRKDQTVG